MTQEILPEETWKLVETPKGSGMTQERFPSNLWLAEAARSHGLRTGNGATYLENGWLRAGTWYQPAREFVQDRTTSSFHLGEIANRYRPESGIDPPSPRQWGEFRRVSRVKQIDEPALSNVLINPQGLKACAKNRHPYARTRAWNVRLYGATFRHLYLWEKVS